MCAHNLLILTMLYYEILNEMFNLFLIELVLVIFICKKCSAILDKKCMSLCMLQYFSKTENMSVLQMTVFLLIHTVPAQIGVSMNMC